MLCEVAGRDLVPVLARQARLLGDDAGLLEALAGGYRRHRRARSWPALLAPWPAGRCAAGYEATPASTPSSIPRPRPRWHGSLRSRAGSSGPASSPGAAASNATPGASGSSGSRVANHDPARDGDRLELFPRRTG